MASRTLLSRVATSAMIMAPLVTIACWPTHRQFDPAEKPGVGGQGNSAGAGGSGSGAVGQGGDDGGAGTAGSGGISHGPIARPWRDEVAYFILVDRFYDGGGTSFDPVESAETAANYQGGNFAGIVQKINEGYFEDLGVTTLWLSVVVDNSENPEVRPDGYVGAAYEGHWPKNLRDVEERFGTSNDFAALVNTAHSANLRVILEYELKQLHSSSPTYAANKGWFTPLCECMANCEGADDFSRCWQAEYLPRFDYTSGDARMFTLETLSFWAEEYDVDGFGFSGVDATHDALLFGLRPHLAPNNELLLVGSSYTVDRELIQRAVGAERLHGQLDYPLRAQIINAVVTKETLMSDLASFLDTNDLYYGADALMGTFLGNRSTIRAIHFAEDSPMSTDPWTSGSDRAWLNRPTLPTGTIAFERLANAFTVILTLPGIPIIYYGDEIGLPGAGEPDNMRMMQWTDYSTGQLHLRQHIEKLTKLRAAHPALRTGERTTLSTTANTLAYQLVTDDDVVTVVINRGDTESTVMDLPEGTLTDQLTGQEHVGPSVLVAARSSMILTK